MNQSYSAWKEKHGKKTEIPSNYHGLVEKCNSKHVSTSCVVRLIDFN